MMSAAIMNNAAKHKNIAKSIIFAYVIQLQYNPNLCRYSETLYQNQFGVK